MKWQSEILYLPKFPSMIMLTMHTKLEDDIFVRSLFMTKNVMFIKEYRETIWGLPVTSSMTSSPWKYFPCIIWDDLFISDVKLKLCLIFWHFQTGRRFEIATQILPWAMLKKCWSRCHLDTLHCISCFVLILQIFTKLQPFSFQGHDMMTSLLMPLSPMSSRIFTYPRCTCM